MAIYGGVTAASINANAQSALLQLREALARCTAFRQWLAAYSASDLVTAGIASTADANDILGAFADADALNQIYLTGLPPGSYPQPGSAYVYASSQRVIVGPLS